MIEKIPPLGEFGHVADDGVVPFAVAGLDIRGRAVQIGPALDAILARHDYPEPVARLLGEAAVLTVLLGTSLKFEGKLIIQTQTDGPVSLLVADFTTPDKLRAYARFDAARLAEAEKIGAEAPELLLGKGVLGLTIDQGEFSSRYQGIVPLDATPLDEAARTYFRQSEQIPTDVRLAVAQLVEPGPNGLRRSWRAGGVLAQFLPESPERMRHVDLPGGDGWEHDSGEDDAWTEVRALMATIGPDELIDPQVGAERLLFRLFHEHGVRVYEGVTIRDACSCSREKLGEILGGFTAEEISGSLEGGKIKVKCEFCSAAYEFEPAEFSASWPAA